MNQVVSTPRLSSFFFFLFYSRPSYLALNCSNFGSQKEKDCHTLSRFILVNHFTYIVFKLLYFFVVFTVRFFLYVCIHLIQFLCQFFALQVSASFDSLVYKVKSRFCISCNIKLNI